MIRNTNMQRKREVLDRTSSCGAVYAFKFCTHGIAQLNCTSISRGVHNCERTVHRVYFLVLARC